MAYLGNDLQVAYQSYKIIDDISSGFNSILKSFALQVGGVTPVPFPINPQQCLISVNGVVQEPDPTGTSGFNLVGNNIVFASAPTTGHSFFGVILAGADYVNVGVKYPSGSESAPSITFDADLDTGIYNPGDNELGFVTNSNDAIRINSSGDVTIGSDLTVDTDTLYVDSANDLVGIGTSSPSFPLSVEATSGQLILAQATSGVAIVRVDSSDPGSDSYFWARATNTGTSSIYFGDPDDGDVGLVKYDHTDDSMAFKVNAQERARIDSSGRLGLGTNNPGFKLTIEDATTPRIRIGDGTRHLNVDGGSTTQDAAIGTDYSGSFGIYTNGAANTRLHVTSAGNVGINTTSPSYTFDVNGSIYATSYAGLPGATTSASGIVQLSDSTSSTSTTTAATPSAVKDAYDLANAALPASGGTMTGDIVFSATQTFTAAGIDLDGPFEQASEAVAAFDVDCSAGNYFTKAISSNSTFTFSNIPTSGTAYSFTLEVDVTGTSTAITWPASVEWPDNTAPSLTDTKTHLFMFVTNDGGTTWRGAALVDYTT